MENLQTPVGEPILVIDVGGTNIKFGYSCNSQPLDFRKLYSTDALRAGDPVPYMERNLVAGLFHAAASLGIAESADRIARVVALPFYKRAK